MVKIDRELADEMLEFKTCGVRLVCGVRFYEEITDVLRKCFDKFYKICDFRRIIKVCPFDPVIDMIDWQHRVEIEELQTRITQLEARLK